MKQIQAKLPITDEQRFWRALRRSFGGIQSAIHQRPLDADTPIWSMMGRALGMAVKAIDRRYGKD